LASHLGGGSEDASGLADHLVGEAPFVVVPRHHLDQRAVDDPGQVITPGQAAVLAVGSAVDRPAAYDGNIVMRSVMDLSLSCDHRILYGADAAAFLADLRGLLEQPFALVG
jgi:pyruvate dehydrogenase E2 component (dihydrolipoamide acetyltransferase)